MINDDARRNAEIATGVLWRRRTLSLLIPLVLCSVMLIVAGELSDNHPLAATRAPDGNLLALPSQSEVFDNDRKMLRGVVMRNLRLWMEGVRGQNFDHGFSGDMRIVARNKTCSGSSADGKLRDWFKKNPLAEEGNEALVSVEIETMRAQADMWHWQIEWLEKEQSLSGDVVRQPARWKALVEFKKQKIVSFDSLSINPSGICVQDFSWSPLI